MSYLPDDRQMIKCKRMFKIKTNPDGLVKRYKGRLVVEGFSQVLGDDNSETYAR